MARTLIRPISSTKTTATASTMGGGGKTAKRLPASRNSSVITKKQAKKQTGVGFTETSTDRTTGKKTTTTGTLKPITREEFNSNTPTKNRALAGRRRGR